MLGVVDVAHPEIEAVARQLPGAQLVGMPARAEHRDAREVELPGDLGVELRHREPLTRHRHAVLASGVAHITRPHGCRTCEVARDLLGGAQRLLEVDEGVATLAGRLVEGDLIDPEILGAGADARC
jgi:hypothetical protein